MKVLKTRSYSEVELGFKRDLEKFCKDRVEVHYFVTDEDFKRIQDGLNGNLTTPKKRLLSRFKEE